MAQIFRDFADTSVGNQPADTTLRRSAASGDYTKQTADSTDVLRYLASSGGTAARGLSYDNITSSGAVEVFAELKDVDESDPASGRLVVYAVDSPDEEYGCYLNLSAANTRITAYVRDDGSFTNLADSLVELDSTTRYGVRLRVTPGSPNEVKARVWDISGSEPETWDIDTTDSALTLNYAGWIGHIGFQENAEVRYYRVGIGTDGDTAPTVPVASAYVNKATSIADNVLTLGGIISPSQWEDESGNDHHAAPAGGTSFSDDSGGPGTALPGYVETDHTLSGRWVVTDHADLDVDSDHTVALWLWNLTGGQSFACWFSKGNDESVQFRQSGSDTTQPRWDVRGGTGGDVAATGSAGDTPTGEWMFVVCDYTGSAIRIRSYDGTSWDTIASASRSGTVGTNALDFMVGAKDDGAGGSTAHQSARYAGLAMFSSLVGDTDLEELYDSTFDAGADHSLTPDSASHTHTADSPALTQLHELTADDAAHTHTADSPALTEQASGDPANLQVTINGATAELSWDASSGVDGYLVFRRTPQTGADFDPSSDTPIADVAVTSYDDEGLAGGDYDWQVYGYSNV